jgi:hypothetical protein
MNEFNYQSLYKRIWITRGCRFQAHRRLNASDNWSTWTINILTVYIISISILSLDPPSIFEFLTKKVSSIFLICVSILILVISIIEASKNYKLKADIMHRCGKELSGIYNEICLIKDGILTIGISEKLIELNSKYQQIVDKYDDNHIELDYNVFMVENHEEFDLSLPKRLQIWAVYTASTKGLYITLITLPLAIFVLLTLIH